MEEVLSKLDAVLDCRKDGRFDKIAEFVDTTPKLKQSPYRGLVLAHLRARLERIGANDALSNFFAVMAIVVSAILADWTLTTEIIQSNVTDSVVELSPVLVVLAVSVISISIAGAMARRKRIKRSRIMFALSYLETSALGGRRVMVHRFRVRRSRKVRA